jgi:hypothetical protein
MKKRSQKNNFVDSWFLLDFEEAILNEYTLLKNWPLFRRWRLKRALNNWNREE